MDHPAEHDAGSRSAERKGQTMRQAYSFTATPASRTAIWLKAGLCGAGGSGKTYTAMALATHLAARLKSGPLYVIDSEHNSALRYARSPRSGKGFEYLHVPMPSGDYSPQAYMAALDFCVQRGARFILIDSLSHEWDGLNGVLEQVDRVAEAAEARGRKPDNFSAWRTLTPLHRAFIEHLLSLPAHIIFTLRAKMTYEMRKDDKGKAKFEKVGLGPIQREGIEYEPDLFFWMNDAVLTVDKTRCDRLTPGATFERPGASFADLIGDWLEDVDPAQSTVPEPKRQEPTAIDLAAKAKNATTPDAAEEVLRIAKQPGIRAHAYAGLVRLAQDPADARAVAPRVALDVALSEEIRQKLFTAIDERVAALEDADCDGSAPDSAVDHNAAQAEAS